MKEKLLISACLCGKNTKYNGKNNKIDISLLENKYDLVLICPEVMGGLSTPRNPSEIKGNKVYSNQGLDVTENFNLGAKLSLAIALNNNIKYALLKEGSPSCGVNRVYDGTFSGNKINGMGITTKLLKENGIIIYSEEDIAKLLNL